MHIQGINYMISVNLLWIKIWEKLNKLNIVAILNNRVQAELMESDMLLQGARDE